MNLILKSMINKTNINKFSVPEMLSSSNGKTSSSAVCGIYIVFIGTLCFFMATIKFCFFNVYDGFEAVLIQSLAMTALGVSLVAIKKLNPTKDTTNTPE